MQMNVVWSFSIWVSFLFHQEIEFEMARTQKNKATEYHLGRLKLRNIVVLLPTKFLTLLFVVFVRGKLAMYRQRLLEPGPTSGASGEGFDVGKHGDARVALVGFPSVENSFCLVVWMCFGFEIGCWFCFDCSSDMSCCDERE
jgi:hypothetical protein